MKWWRPSSPFAGELYAAVLGSASPMASQCPRAIPGGSPPRRTQMQADLAAPPIPAQVIRVSAAGAASHSGTDRATSNPRAVCPVATPIRSVPGRICQPPVQHRQRVASSGTQTRTRRAGPVLRAVPTADRAGRCHLLGGRDHRRPLESNGRTSGRTRLVTSRRPVGGMSMFLVCSHRRNRHGGGILCSAKTSCSRVEPPGLVIATERADRSVSFCASDEL